MLNTHHKKLIILIFFFSLSLIFINENLAIDKYTDQLYKAATIGGLFKITGESTTLLSNDQELIVPPFYIPENYYYFDNHWLKKNIESEYYPVTINNHIIAQLVNTTQPETFKNAYFYPQDMDYIKDKLNIMKKNLNIFLPIINLNQESNWHGLLDLNQADFLSPWHVYQITKEDNNKFDIYYQVKNNQYYLLIKNNFTFKINGLNHEEQSINLNTNATQPIFIENEQNNLSFSLLPENNDKKYLGRYDIQDLSILNTHLNKELLKKESFENNLSDFKLKDCSGEKGLALIEMKKNNDSSDGKSSLELKAASHQACTRVIINLNKKDATIYKVSFDYKNIAGDTAHSHVFLDNQSVAKKEFKTQDHDWHHYEILVKSQMDSKSISVFFYAKSDGTKKVTNIYDNLIITEVIKDKTIDLSEYFTNDSYKLVADLELVKNNKINIFPSNNLINDNSTATTQEIYLMRQGQTQADKNKKINFHKINKAKHLVTIQNISQPFLLVFSKKYQTGWQAFIAKENKREQIPTSNHLIVNGYANSWWIDTQKFCQNNNYCIKNNDNTYSLDIIIEYGPQKIYHLSLFLSMAIFLILLFYILRQWQNDKSNKKS